MRNLLNTRPNLTPTFWEEPSLGEYVETVDNIPSPVKNEEPNVEKNSNRITINEHVETTDTTNTTEVKVEEEQDTKTVLDNIHSRKKYVEIIT